MAFIKEYNIAIPRFRITDNSLHPRLGRNGQHSICFSDEDLITLVH